jgi:hypothetical protein
MVHMMLLMNLHHPMTSLALLSPKTMIVIGTCNSSPICCNKCLLIYKFFDLILAKYLLDIDL